MNRVYKVIFNRVKGRYEVVSELAKNGGKASGHSFFTTMAGSGGKLTKSIVLALLLLGSSYGVNAATVHDGDTLTGSTNITVTKDDTSNDVVITATGLATTADVNANKTDITANTTQIDANKNRSAPIQPILLRTNSRLMPIPHRLTRIRQRSIRTQKILPHYRRPIQL